MKTGCYSGIGSGSTITGFFVIEVTPAVLSVFLAPVDAGPFADDQLALTL
jgi:hypothetical protein